MKFDLLGFKYFAEKNNEIPQNHEYKVQFFPIRNHTCTYTEKDYSVVGFTMVLERHYGKYILEFYLPSTILVMASWVSFLIPAHIVPGRMALLITLLLVLINQFSTIIKVVPPSDSPPALVIWALCCILFVGGSLMVYAALLFKQFTKKKSMKNKITSGRRKKQQKEESFVVDETSNWDRSFAICFPLCFLIFNAIYWPSIFLGQPVVIQPFSTWEV